MIQLGGRRSGRTLDMVRRSVDAADIGMRVLIVTPDKKAAQSLSDRFKLDLWPGIDVRGVDTLCNGSKITFVSMDDLS